MGNKQGTTSVFRDEEDEETWFEWMETTGHRKNQKQLTISPKTEILPVQPTGFQADANNRPRNTKQKISGLDKALKGLHLESCENDSISDNKSIRSDGTENNNLPRIKGNVVENDLEALAGQVGEVTETTYHFISFVLKIGYLFRLIMHIHACFDDSSFFPSTLKNIT